MPAPAALSAWHGSMLLAGARGRPDRRFAGDLQPDWLLASLTDQVRSIGGQVPEPADQAGGPGHLDLINKGRRSQPKMDSGIAGRLITPASVTEADETATSRTNTHPRSDRVPVRGNALEPEGDRVAGGGLVVHVGQGFVLGEKQQVDPAVVVQVADGQPASEPRYLPGRTRRGRETSSSFPAPVPRKSWAGMA